MRAKKRDTRKLTMIAAVVLAVVVTTAGALLVLRARSSASRASTESQQAQEDTTTDGRYQVSVINSQADADNFEASHKRDDIAVPDADYDAESLIAVRYPAPSTGYGITVTASDGTVDILLNTPGDSCFNTQKITNIYGFAVADKGLKTAEIGTISEQQNPPCPR